MDESVIKIIFGIGMLFLGFFIGNFLAKTTKEELKSGRVFFITGIFLSIIFSVVFLFFKIYSLFFTFLFMAIVFFRSWKISFKK